MSWPQWNFSYFNNTSVVHGFKFKFISVSVYFNGKKKNEVILWMLKTSVSFWMKKDLKSISWYPRSSIDGAGQELNVKLRETWQRKNRSPALHLVSLHSVSGVAFRSCLMIRSFFSSFPALESSAWCISCWRGIQSCSPSTSLSASSISIATRNTRSTTGSPRACGPSSTFVSLYC